MKNALRSKTSYLSYLIIVAGLSVLMALVGCKGGAGSPAADSTKAQPAAGAPAEPSGSPGAPGNPPSTPPGTAPGTAPGAAPGQPPMGQPPVEAGPPMTPSGPPDQVVAKVNGTEIKRGALDFAVKNIFANQKPLPLSQQAQARKSVLDELVDQELLYQKAVGSNFGVTDAEVADSMAKIKTGFADEKAFNDQLAADGINASMLERMLRQRMVITKFVRSTIVDKIKIAPEDETKFYEANKEKLKHPEQVRASHILRLVKQNATPEEKKAQKAKADEALARARKGEDFAALAKQLSEDGSAANGGDLGFFSKTDMVAPFANAAFALKPGEISDVVESQFGYHIIKLTDRRPEGYTPLEDVKKQIDGQLQNQQIQGELEKLRAALRSAAKIEVTL